MDMVPLAEGDLLWVFPALADPRPVYDVLDRAARRIEELATHLGVSPSWTGTGLEFHRLHDDDAATLYASAETPGVTFVAELRVPPCGTSTSTWLVDGEITVLDPDLNPHVLEDWPDAEHATPLAAAQGFLDVTNWLFERGLEEPPETWHLHQPYLSVPR